jgi:hypothetical protein
VEGGGEEPRGERDGDGRRPCEAEEREGERVAAPVRWGAGLGLGRLYRWKGAGWARLVFGPAVRGPIGPWATGGPAGSFAERLPAWLSAKNENFHKKLIK